MKKKARKAEEPTDAPAAAVEAEGDGEKSKAMPRKWRAANSAEGKRQQELQQRNCTKYHYVKFIEKQKVERKLTKCRNKLERAEAAGETKAAKVFRKELRSHLANYEYVNHYPKHLPYNALFPTEDTEASQRRREQVRQIIRKQLAAEGVEGLSALGAEGEAVEDNYEGETELADSKEIDPRTANKAKPSEDAAARKKRNKKEASRRKRDLKRKGGQVGAVSAKAEPAVKGGEVSAVEVKAKKAKVAENSGEVGKPVAVQQKQKQLSKADRKSAVPDAPAGDHPSWQASKSSKVKGSLVESAGERKVFDESESE